MSYCVLYCKMKRYYIIDQHLARHFKYKGECLSSPPPILCGQIILTPFLIQLSPPIRIQGCNFSQLWNPCVCVATALSINLLLVAGNVLLLWAFSIGPRG